MGASTAMMTSSSTLLHGRIYGNDILLFSAIRWGGLLCSSEDDEIVLGKSLHQLAQEVRIKPVRGGLSLSSRGRAVSSLAQGTSQRVRNRRSTTGSRVWPWSSRPPPCLEISIGISEPPTTEGASESSSS